MEASDGNYSINPWMRPEQRLGDDVDPSVWLDPAEVIFEIAAQAPMPPPAGYTPRLLGFPRVEPGITDVLGMGPSAMLQEKDMGQAGTLRPSTGGY